MKIIIIGAGISGLSTYLFLSKHLPHFSSHKITIVEAYDTTKPNTSSSTAASILATSHTSSVDSDGFETVVVGSALGLLSNGLNILRRIDADGTTKTHDRIVSRGRLCTTWTLATARGWNLGQMDIASSQGGGKGSEEPITSSDDDRLLGPGLMIIRHRLWECLRDSVVKAGGKILTKRVVDIVIDDGGGTQDWSPVKVAFSDGSADSADLVLGADGLRSVVRKAIFRKEKEKGGPDYITPHYEGLCGIGGWLPSKVIKGKGVESGTVKFTFGANGFFGCGFMAPSSEASKLLPVSESTESPSADDEIVGWWSTYSSPTPPNPKSYNKSQTIDDLLARHKSWKIPHVPAIMAHVEAHRDRDTAGLLDAVYPTYTSPPIPTYAAPSGRLVLIGDSAHALQPSSGQGAGQALEDAESYVRLLSHYLQTHPQDQLSETQAASIEKSLSTAGELYTNLRRPRVMAIYERSQKMGGRKKTMNVVQEFLVYIFIWLLTLFPDRYNKKLLKYDVPSEVENVIASQARSLSESQTKSKPV